MRSDGSCRGMEATWTVIEFKREGMLSRCGERGGTVETLAYGTDPIAHPKYHLVERRDAE